MITLSENFRALFYTPFYAAHAIGAYEAEQVEVRLRELPDPARTAADLRAGRIDVMWGGPLRVLLTHAADPASDLVCFCDVVARDPFFVIGREPKPDFRPRDLLGMRFRLGRRGADAMVVPARRHSPRRRRSGRARPPHGPSMAENAAALRAGTARRDAGVPAVRRGIVAVGRRPFVVRGGRSRADRLYDAGDAAVGAGQPARRTGGDGAGDGTGRCAGSPPRRGPRWRARWRRSSPTCRRRFIAAAIDRYRRWAFTEPIRSSGARASTGCRPRCGPAARWTAIIPFDVVVDNSLAEAVAR